MLKYDYIDDKEDDKQGKEVHSSPRYSGQKRDFGAHAHESHALPPDNIVLHHRLKVRLPREGG